MSLISKDKVNYLTVIPEESGQRIDNYLIRQLKGVPKNHIYKIIHSGQIRINKKRVKVEQKIQAGDLIRIPPIKISMNNLTKQNIPSQEFPIIYEDDGLIIINKPAGIAVHGGSGISFGVIEQIRKSRPNARYLELIHRLDKDTSGLLMIAKKRAVLLRIHEQLRNNHPEKIYLALSIHPWNKNNTTIKLPLIKYTGQAGEKMVKISTKGQYAHTNFELIESFKDYSLLKVTLKTGRTHQIRVHMQSQNAPIAGDERYGNYEINKQLQKIGLKRMFLHAYQLRLNYPDNTQKQLFEAPLPKQLQQFLENLRNDDI